MKSELNSPFQCCKLFCIVLSLSKTRSHLSNLSLTEQYFVHFFRNHRQLSIANNPDAYYVVVQRTPQSFSLFKKNAYATKSLKTHTQTQTQKNLPSATNLLDSCHQPRTTTTTTTSAVIGL